MHLGSLRAFKKGYFSTRKRLCGSGALEQGPASILQPHGCPNVLERAEHRAMLCTSVLVHNTIRCSSSTHMTSILQSSVQCRVTPHMVRGEDGLRLVEVLEGIRCIENQSRVKQGRG